MRRTDHPALVVVEHPLVQEKLTRLRDAGMGVAGFRRLVRELALLLLYEVTRNLPTRAVEVHSPLAKCDGCCLARPVVIVPILRAALGMAEAMIELLPEATVGHIGIFRDEQTHRPRSYYARHPSHLAEASTILVDPMLATGHSAAAALTQLKEAGATSLAFVCLVSCPEGIAELARAHPDVPVFTASIDSHLDENAYIVPGLGDAGDRYFGTM